jgi:putative spermidine/putrescine transport system substrate-binding protein
LQLDAAVTLLKKQRRSIGEYWSDYTKEVSAFKAGSTVIGTTWQVIANIAAEKSPVKAILPEGGSTGWSDTWMVAAKAQHPSCAYRWADYVVSPKVNAQVAEYFGEAPANLKACAQTSDKSFCAGYHAADAAYADKIYYWSTPLKQCLDGRTDVQCTDYAAWTTAWQEIKG